MLHSGNMPNLVTELYSYTLSWNLQAQGPPLILAWGKNKTIVALLLAFIYSGGCGLPVSPKYSQCSYGIQGLRHHIISDGK